MISKITENLFIGSSQDALNKTVLDDFGITAIVNVAKDLNDPWFDGIKYVKIGMMDGDSAENKGMYLLAGLSVIYLTLEGEKVLLHCHEGKSRSCAIAVAVLAADQTTGANESFLWATKEVSEKRQEMNIKPGHFKHIIDAITVLRNAT